MGNMRIGKSGNMAVEMEHFPSLEASEIVCSPQLKVWEIDPFFKCPVVGICLTLSEQKQVLKKAGVSPKGKSPFEIHEILVGCSENENRVSMQMGRRLNRKYGAEIKPLLKLNEKVLMGHWASCFFGGEFAGVFWAAATKPDLSVESRGRIFGDIHMSMHDNVDQSVRIKKQLAFHREEGVKMSVKAREAVRGRKTLQKENGKLLRERDDLRRKLAAREREINRLNLTFSKIKSKKAAQPLGKDHEVVGLDFSHYAKAMKEKDAILTEMSEENRRLSHALQEEKENGMFLKRELKTMIQQPFGNGQCDETCPSYDLCKRRVLMVGGLTKMASLYREVIERQNGIFEYHDGYMQKGAKTLESRVRRADMVLCPVTCNSHAACSLVKNLGKKHNTPVRLLAGASLSAVGEALAGKGGVYVSDN
ncbi:MAG: DUF2325 domain-containing protein [Deltaproteobacteria bacterium]|nr:DUF2325 domain-containing protein [Deltaproteobacteria bacterium]